MCRCILSLKFQVVQFWDEGLEDCVEELGEERWMVMEQVRWMRCWW